MTELVISQIKYFKNYRKNWKKHVERMTLTGFTFSQTIIKYLSKFGASEDIYKWNNSVLKYQ